MTATETTGFSAEVNAIVFHAPQDSKIININLYSGRAEITRLFSFLIKAGQNKITVLGLPRTFLEDSLKVEGDGNAAIHDVTISRSLPSAQSPASASIDHGEPLNRKRKEINRALGSARQSLLILDSYMHTVTAKEFDINRLETTLDGYKVLTRKADNEILNLEEELSELDQKIDNEKKSHTFIPSWQAVINVHGQADEEVKMYLKYAVHSANWTASYDVRVDTRVKEKATIIYKAIITQNTGESWDNVPLTLETVAPSFGISPPVLLPWRLKPLQNEATGRRSRFRSRSPRRSSPRSRSPGPHSPRYSPTSPKYSPTSPSFEPMEHLVANVSTKDSIVATFRVPGFINVTCDGDKHSVTIAQLRFDAKVMWYTIPVSDTGVHIKAKIRNESDYTFIPGSANIYVDGNFMGTTNIPSTSPQGLLDCPLGLDPSIRVTYHPREKKASVAGFYQKKSTQSFTQRITVLNTKSTTIENLRVIEHVPVSEDELIEVKLHNPPLSMPPTGPQSVDPVSLTNKVHEKGAEDVTAQWDGSDEEGIDHAALGRNGRFSWHVSIPPQKSVSLVAQYDVNYPVGTTIQGL